MLLFVYMIFLTVVFLRNCLTNILENPVLNIYMNVVAGQNAPILLPPFHRPSSSLPFSVLFHSSTKFQTQLECLGSAVMLPVGLGRTFLLCFVCFSDNLCHNCWAFTTTIFTTILCKSISLGSAVFQVRPVVNGRRIART